MVIHCLCQGKGCQWYFGCSLTSSRLFLCFWNEILMHLFLLFSQKRPAPFDSLERLAVKRQKLVDQRLQQQPTVNGLLNSNRHDTAAPPLIPSFHTKTEFQRTSNLTGNHSGLPVGQNGFPLMHKLSSTSETHVSESREQETKFSKHQPPQSDSDCAHQQLTSSQHRKKKSKKHKDKERERLKDNKGSKWLETTPDLKQKPTKLDSKDLCEKIFLVIDDLPFSVIVWRTIRTFY